MSPSGPLDTKKKFSRKPAAAEHSAPSREQVSASGYNAVRALLEFRPQDCAAFFVSETRRPSKELDILLRLARDNGIKPRKVENSFFDRLGPRPQGLAVIARPKREPGLKEFLQSCPGSGPGLIVVLDHLEDPRNFGAVIRSAAAFGALGIVYPQDRAAPVNIVARGVSTGGTEVLPLVRVVNLGRALEEMKKRGFWVVAAEAGSGADSLLFDYPERTALVLGSEGGGQCVALTSRR